MQFEKIPGLQWKTLMIRLANGHERKKIESFHFGKVWGCCKKG